MKTKLTYGEIASVCLEMSMFVHAGMTGGGALSLIADATKDSRLKSSFSDMAKAADSGTPTSEVFASCGMFPAEMTKMLRVGETTGKTEETFSALAKYYDRLEENDRQMRYAVLYPSTLMLVMIAVILLLLTYVLPIFSDVYASLGGSLTGFAGFLLAVGNALSAAVPVLIIFGIGAVAALAVFSVSQAARGRMLGIGARSDKGIGKKLASARFARALAMTLSSGLTFGEAMATSANLLSNEMKQKCLSVAELISGGESASDAIAAADLLPPTEERLLALGISGGNPEAAAYEITRRLEREADDAIASAVGRIEPVMVTVSSLLIGAILLSVMLPLTDIMSTIGG